MPMTATTVYLGELRCESTHILSGSKIYTDAPPDNQGKGASFSPTDLVATATATCMLTIMGIKARDHNWNINGTRAEVVKIMSDQPRRISGLSITVHMPEAFIADDKCRTLLENAARNCPVILSLSSDMHKDIRFIWS